MSDPPDAESVRRPIHRVAYRPWDFCLTPLALLSAAHHIYGLQLKLAVATPPKATVSPAQTFPSAHMPRLVQTAAILSVVVSGLACLAEPVVAQRAAPQSAAFDHGFVLGGEWLQANALPLNRNTLGSMSAEVSLRGSHWAIDAGYLRIARELSTVQGGFVSFGVPLAWGRVLAIPSIGAFGGQAQRSVDSTGYDFISPSGVPGHVPRYSFSTSGSAGGGVGLTIEVPVYRVVALRASASEWYFSGATLEGDRSRSLIGVGLSIRVPQLGGIR